MSPPAELARVRAAVNATADSRSEEAARMEREVVARAQQFSLGALADILVHLGYAPEDLEFRSRATTTHQSSLIAAVAFAAPPARRVTIVVNLGLLGPQSPLPSYFQRLALEQSEGALAGFVNFFAHHLLLRSVQAQFPERDNTLFSDWRATLADVRSLLGLRTTYAVHWLFDHVYPELGVAVARTQMIRRLHTRPVRLGGWATGDGATLGGVTDVPVRGVAVQLLADEATAGNGVSWSVEAEARLRRFVFPVLAHHGVSLFVQLLLRDQRNFMVLRPKEYLGYAPLSSGPGVPPPARSVRTIILWDDEVPAA